MTSRVTVDAHAGWPVQVESFDQNEGDEKPILVATERVEANTDREFHVWNGRTILITELRDG